MIRAWLMIWLLYSSQTINPTYDVTYTIQQVIYML